MDTRPVLPLQQQQQQNQNNKGGGGVMGAGEGNNNRRALGDIGNLVPVPIRAGIDMKVDRPVTRSFCAQLVSNAQVKAAENNHKVVGREGVKSAQKKVVTVKPQPDMIIEISPDTTEGEKFENRRATSKAKSGSSRRKKAHSLTSVLTARSKLASGLTGKPKDLPIVVDIDAVDVDNHLAAVEYVEDIYKYYKLTESRVHDYMGSHPDINEKMRGILIDWLIEVHSKFELMQETLFLTIQIVDLYLSLKFVSRRQLQLVGISSMLIASKYEEVWAPEVNDFVCISDRAYTREQVLGMEKAILGKLEWNLTVPTPYVFLVRYIKAASVDDPKMENMAFFLAELGLVHYECIMYCPSMLAASAVYAARCTLNTSPHWNETLQLHTGFTESHLVACAKLLVNFHSASAADKLQVVCKKYSIPERCSVALLPPAKIPSA